MYVICFLGHLPHQKRRVLWRRDNFTSTYVTFSPNGRELLANMGSEQIYLFDVFHGNPILLDSLNFKNFVAKCGTIHEGKLRHNKIDFKRLPGFLTPTFYSKSIFMKSKL